MLLQGRTDDPEEILKSLGFVNTEEADNPIERKLYHIMLHQVHST
jgi:hypothetical protein